MVELHARCGGGEPETSRAAEDNLTDAAGTRSDALAFFYGLLFLLGLVAVLVYSPSLIPLAYLGFAAIAFPHRVITFHKKRWTFYLVDFCYFANAACCAFFLAAPEDARAEAAVWALCEGPLAAALIAWQSAWLLGSPGHVVRWGGGERQVEDVLGTRARLYAKAAMAAKRSSAAVVVDDNFSPLGVVYLEDVEAELIRQRLLNEPDANFNR
ncbi:hypothetical protein TSOC_002421 [Tetrabaena socialis]|uniref:Glycerophosphocholine acyltransferase 1 n=1 Tax=Tetrabaena socialis TaxID=47790 RepID=A0A2J8AE44_9CHLO|nr:hypothetical protein TSOC_002421 [Tetrabaena socialis]|eukprot:PNH10790.1 hypothetical protein TSOC_002421 [Tetrabaena socialis]